jgi:hypothetical protein
MCLFNLIKSCFITISALKKKSSCQVITYLAAAFISELLLLFQPDFYNPEILGSQIGGFLASRNA